MHLHEATTRVTTALATRRRAAFIACALAIAGAVTPSAPAGAVVPGANGRVAFVSDRNGHDEIYSANADGRSLLRLTHSPSNRQADHPAWSPDGKWVVYDRDNGVGVDLWVVDRSGQHQHQITHLPGVAAEPSWAPDGNRIVFQYFTGSALQDLYTVRRDGTGLVRITNTPRADEVLASFSPNGAWLAYGYVTYAGTRVVSHVRLSRTDGSGTRTITPDRLNGGRPSWSPDGRTIVFSSNNNGGPGLSQSLYTIAADDTHLRRLTTVHTGAGDTFATYSPDGRFIAFSSDRARSDGSDGSDVYVIDATGGAVRDLTPHTSRSREFDPDWQRPVAGIPGAGIAGAGAAAAPKADPWLFVMCKTADHPTPPAAPTNTFFHDLFATAGKGIQKYFSMVSNNGVTLAGTTITPWIQTSYSVADESRKVAGTTVVGYAALISSGLHAPDANGHSSDDGKIVSGSGFAPGTTIVSVHRSGSTVYAATSTSALATTTNTTYTLQKDRLRMATDCIYSGTTAGQDLSKYEGIAAVWDAQIFDAGNAGFNTNLLTNRGPSHRYGIVVADAPIWMKTSALPLTQAWFEHEMLHGFGLGHSWDTGTTVCGGGKPGEYCDPGDVMSNLATPWRFTSTEVVPTGMSAGPGLNGAFLDDLGWIPAGRYIAGAGTFTLAGLGHSDAPGYLVATITVATKTAPFSKKYEVELRTPDRWDTGFPMAGVMIHTYGTLGSFPITYVMQTPSHVKLLGAGTTYSDANVRIKVNSIAKVTTPLGSNWQASVTLAAA